MNPDYTPSPEVSIWTEKCVRICNSKKPAPQVLKWLRESNARYLGAITLTGDDAVRRASTIRNLLDIEKGNQDERL